MQTTSVAQSLSALATGVAATSGSGRSRPQFTPVRWKSTSLAPHTKSVMFATVRSATIFTGFFNDSTYVRYYQLAADVLVSYYTSKDHLVEFNYPQKVNEYMTTGNVVVTPDFPATRDVLNERNVIFVKPDDPQALADGLRRAVEDPEHSRRLAIQAKEDLKALTFERRTAEFLSFAERL